jgi:hypothetical protein
MKTLPRQSTLFKVISSRLAAFALAVLATANIAWAPAVPLPDETPLTPAQEASIRDEMTGLGQMLVSGGKSPQEAKLAANAVGLCLGAAYGYGLSRAEAEAVCGEVLDAFIIQPGATHYELTPDDRAWISTKILGWSSELSLLLEPDQLAAAQSTMQACLEGYMRRGEERGDAVGRCALGLLPILNRPELRQRLLQSAGKLP